MVLSLRRLRSIIQPISGYKRIGNVHTGIYCQPLLSSSAPVASQLINSRFLSMECSNELNWFLKSAKTAIEAFQSFDKIHLVIGNESADLDSVVSAVVYAFYLSKIPKNVNNRMRYIPVVSVHQDDLALRTEVMAVLRKFEIPSENLVYLNEVDLPSLPVTNVTLVDHNNCATHLGGISGHVSQIIDHHEDSEDFKIESKNIKTVGSCSTLVTEEIHYSKHPILSIYPIADLLLSAVLIDTFNLDLHSGRTKELDIFMGEILSNYSSQEPDSLFECVQKAKMDISSMSTYNILRKDYKPVDAAMGISSATLASSNLLFRSDFLQAAKSHINRLSIDILIIMFLTITDGSLLPHRELAVVAMDTNHIDMVSSYLISDGKDLQLSERDNIPSNLKQNVRLFHQNPKLSRKFVLPLLQRYASICN